MKQETPEGSDTELKAEGGYKYVPIDKRRFMEFLECKSVTVMAVNSQGGQQSGWSAIRVV